MILQNGIQLTLGASAFGSLFVGPLPVGLFVVAVRLFLSTSSGTVTMQAGLFARRVPGITAAAFAAAGRFNTPSGVGILSTATGQDRYFPLGAIIEDGFQYVGVGITTAAGAAFNGGVFVDLEGYTDRVVRADLASDSLPHSAGFYGMQPGPG